MSDTRTLQVGAARVTVINAGDLALRLADDMAVDEALWRPQYADLFERHGACPSLSFLIQLDGATTLVDVGDYRATVPADSPYHIAGYTPPPDIPTQLASAGVRPEDISHIIITHAHWDHYAGVTEPRDGGYAPVYPNARVVMGAADWEYEETQNGLADPTSVESRTLGVARERGLLDLISGQRVIAPGVTVLPAPGETPGHQIVRVQSGGATLYLLGDLFHHEIEVEHPDWMVSWATPEPMLASRRGLMDAALAEDALLAAAHIASTGRLERAGDGVRWVAQAES